MKSSWYRTLVLGSILAGGPALGQVVSVYDGPLYVDPGSSSAVQSALQTTYTVTTFTGTPPASIPGSSSVDIAPGQFAGVEVIVFPFSSGSLDTNLTQASLDILSDAVTVEGKGLVTIGSGGLELLNRIFFPIPSPSLISTGTGGPSSLTSGSMGTPFEGGPAVLNEAADRAMNRFIFTPAGYTNLYEDVGLGSTVFTVSSGNGSFGYLGWNFTPESDADWNTVLGTMVSTIAVPEPSRSLMSLVPIAGMLFCQLGRWLRRRS